MRFGTDGPMNATEFFKNEHERIERMIKSPEALAAAAADATLAEYFNPNQRHKEWEPWREELDAAPDIPALFSKWLRHQENTFYGMTNAKRDLQIKGGKR